MHPNRRLPGLAGFFAAVILALPAASFGWNDTGHKLIACIAYDELTPAARDTATQLLKQHPRYEQDLLAGIPDGFDPARYAFMMAATWPDIVRGQTHPMHFIANHPAWHYIDIPIVKPGYAGPGSRPTSQPTVAGATPPGDPANILEALRKVAADLGNPQVAAGDRAIALCWVLHLGGDIHQPLHGTSFYSAQYPDGDRGGNAALVLRMPNQFYSQVNLHSLWDQMLGTYRSPEIIGYLAAGLRSDQRFAREKLGAELAVREFSAWAQESHDLALTAVYLNCQLETAAQTALAANPETKIPSLPPDYVEHGEDVASHRAILAGYRTADLITRWLRIPATE